jgi:hypothetical protein
LEDDIYSIVKHSFDFVRNKGIMFDFNDSVIKKLVKNDLELKNTSIK